MYTFVHTSTGKEKASIPTTRACLDGMNPPRERLTSCLNRYKDMNHAEPRLVFEKHGKAFSRDYAPLKIPTY